MSDLISRQTAIDTVRKCSVKEVTPAYMLIDKAEVITELVMLPSAQPEIIRCKDCKHYQFADNRAFGMPVKMCEWFGFEDVDEDDFCSRAERRIGMALSAQNVPSVTPQPKYEDIAKAFQFGLAIGFGKKYDEMDRVIDEIKKVICKGEQEWQKEVKRINGDSN